MSRMEQINELLRAELAQAINREIYLDGGLITITRIKCSPDLSQATVFVSILPEGLSGTALNLLRKNSGQINGQLGKKLNLKRIPRFNWKIDNVERHAAEVDEAIGIL